MSILPRAIYRFNAIPIKLPAVFFTELEQIISQFVWKYKKTSNSQSNLEKEWNWRNQPAWLQTILQILHDYTTIIKIVEYWHKDRNIDKWNKIESPEINPCTYGHLIFVKRGKNIQWRKDNLFNKRCWEHWSTTHKRMKLEHFLTPYTKNKFKMNWRSKHKTTNYNPPTGKRRQNTLWCKSQQDLLWPTSQKNENKSENKTNGT